MSDENGAAPVGLFDALFAAKGEIPTLSKDETATVQTQKGSYQYSYASLASTKAIVDPILHKHRLLWRTFPIGTSEHPELAYRMTHVPSRESEEGVMPLILSKQDSQAHGSAMTYGRRYALWAYLDLVGDEDDDGAAASQPAFHRESRADGGASDTVDLRGSAKGLRDEAINAARATVGLPKLEKPWGSLVNIPAGVADEFEKALDAARAAS